MEVDEILNELTYNTGVFPLRAVEAAVQKRDEITPELLRVLEETVSRPNEILAEDKDGAYFAHIYAMYLLAQFRETRAYPLVVRFAGLDEDTLDALAGDFTTEGLNRTLASVCDGDTGPIERLIEDPNVYEYARSAALRALLVLVGEGDKSRDEVMAYFKELFEGKLERSHSHAWNSLVDCATHLYPGDVADQIDSAFEDGLVDPMFIGPEHVERALQRGEEYTLGQLHKAEGGYIEDTVEELEWWACFTEQRSTRSEGALASSSLSTSGTPERLHHSTRIKPNATCPCGSGKKWVLLYHYRC